MTHPYIHPFDIGYSVLITLVKLKRKVFEKINDLVERIHIYESISFIVYQGIFYILVSRDKGKMHF